MIKAILMRSRVRELTRQQEYRDRQVELEYRMRVARNPKERARLARERSVSHLRS